MAAAVSFGVFGFGFAVTVNLQYDLAATVFGIGALTSLLFALGLFAEYIVRFRLQKRNSDSSAYQFTLGEIMVVTAGVALLVVAIRSLDLPYILILCTGLLLFICRVEEVCMRATRNCQVVASNNKHTPAEVIENTEADDPDVDKSEAAS